MYLKTGKIRKFSGIFSAFSPKYGDSVNGWGPGIWGFSKWVGPWNMMIPVNG